MAEKYRAIVNYHFKKDKRDEAIDFLNENLTKHAKEFGCHDIEFLSDEKNPEHIIGTGVWNSASEAKNFQTKWDTVEKDLMKFCTEAPKRKLYKIETHWTEKGRKVA